MKNITLALAALASAFASAFTFDDIDFWVGSGTNRAAFVVDFQDGQTPAAYAWGFRWDGSATGEDMLRAIDAADTTLQTSLLNFGALGYALDTLNYGTRSGPAWPVGYWSYYNGTSATSWTYASTGMSQRTLANDTWDGWSYVRGGTEAEPRVPVAAPVPEPASLLALVGGMALILRRRSR